ncbi:Pkinase-domain-containing protein [Dendrothele bispora CBS 962.96]|uniref:non-specific serine/threonine protein kinase n=1 Tax=Dendrothele bispora (strain CBS 962.96) TaxID=1314807 RepID=A0A4S8L5K6_DENBC|nr:Pkinase-domain-containing protein [Dendrothele bispora CBS 962.96]
MTAPRTKSSASPTAGSSRRDDYEDAKPYVVSTEIGKGSFATVYKGYHEDSRKQVAIKAVKREKLSPKLLDNLQSEIHILKALSHRHITKLIEIVRSDHYIYLVMEYCSGGDLTNYIKKRGRVETLEYIPSPGAAPKCYPHPPTGGLDEIVVRSFLRQLARALKFLRHRNLIHRDIKPQNLLLNPAPPEELARGHPLGVPILKVADFGFARSLPNTMLAETLCGSPLYMAPEILAYKKYDAKADLWSVGAVLYETAVGRPPFRAQNHIELLKKIEKSSGIKFPDEDPTSSAAKNGGGGSEALPVPSDVKKLIRMLLKQKPAERASFDEFFGSTALQKSKFPRPREEDADGDVGIPKMIQKDGIWRPVTPEHHKVIPPEVLDENAMIPPSRFNFRRTSTLGKDGEGSPPPAETPLPYVVDFFQ